MEKNKIKVCHFTSVHSATDGRIFEKECTSLAKAGYEVYLVAPDAEEGVKNGVHIVNVPRKNKGRFYRMFFLSKAVYKKALSLDADIYHFHDPELLLYAKRLKKCGKKVIFDSHEDVPVLILTRQWLPRFCRKMLSYFYEKYEKHIVSQIDAVISVTPLIVDRFRLITNKVYMITNYPRIKSVSIDERKNRQICFCGNITDNYLLTNVINAISNLEDVKFVLAGKPAYKSAIKKLELLQGWEKVSYYGHISKSEVEDIYKQSSIGVLIHKYSLNLGGKEGSLGIIKLFEYMMFGLPFIATDFNLIKNIVKKYNCGICVNPEDVSQIRETIQYFVKHPDIARKMGENGRKAVEKEFNWATQEKVLLKMYDKLH